METCSLEDKVIGYLCKKYDKNYTGKLKYTVDGDAYRLDWLMNQEDQPYIMAGEFNSEDEFFDYVCKLIDKTRIYLKQVFMIKYL